MNKIKDYLRTIGRLLGWTRSSTTLLGIFWLTVFLIGYVWWPLLEEYISTYNPDYPLWVQLDKLLIGNFLAMSLLLVSNANLKRDFPMLLIGLVGGLVIEGWGTQTELWVYYTAERPPFWIIPAWPIASLSIDRLNRILQRFFRNVPDRFFNILHWLIFIPFMGLLLVFVWPTITKSLTIMAILLCLLIILVPSDPRQTTLTFIAGSGLGYFLELWGTTRECWIYYTLETPPFFAVLAHGMAAVAFWRVYDLYKMLLKNKQSPTPQAEKI